MSTEFIFYVGKRKEKKGERVFSNVENGDAGRMRAKRVVCKKGHGRRNGRV